MWINGSEAVTLENITDGQPLFVNLQQAGELYYPIYLIKSVNVMYMYTIFVKKFPVVVLIFFSWITLKAIMARFELLFAINKEKK